MDEKASDRASALCAPVLNERKNLHTLLFPLEASDASDALYQAVRENTSIIVCEWATGNLEEALQFNRVSSTRSRWAGIKN